MTALLGGWVWRVAVRQQVIRHEQGFERPARAVGVGAVALRQRVEHVSRGGVAGKGIIAGHNETQSGGHFLKRRQGGPFNRRCPSPFVCTHSGSIHE